MNTDFAKSLYFLEKKELISAVLNDLIRSFLDYNSYAQYPFTNIHKHKQCVQHLVHSVIEVILSLLFQQIALRTRTNEM